MAQKELFNKCKTKLLELLNDSGAPEDLSISVTTKEFINEKSVEKFIYF